MEMEFKYNCFACGGFEPDCGVYVKYKPGDTCLYRDVAHQDMEKLEDGKGLITLGNMLEDYVAQTGDEQLAELLHQYQLRLNE